MQNTNITYFHSEQDSISWLCPPEIETFEVYAPAAPSLPCIRLESHKNLVAHLAFTIIFLAIFAFVRLRGKDLLHNLFNAFLKRKKAEIILNEGISSNLICYLLALCLSFSILAIGIAYLIQGSFINVFALYLFIGLFFYHFVLLLVIRLLSWTYNSKNIASEVIVNVWTFHILTGLLISPFVIAIFFVKSFAVEPLSKIAIFGTLLLISVKIIRWIKILIAHRVSILYTILYLCTLEIMPLLVLYKLVG